MAAHVTVCDGVTIVSDPGTMHVIVSDGEHYYGRFFTDEVHTNYAGQLTLRAAKDFCDEAQNYGVSMPRPNEGGTSAGSKIKLIKALRGLFSQPTSTILVRAAHLDKALYALREHGVPTNHSLSPYVLYPPDPVTYEDTPNNDPYDERAPF